jgi:hypothetical protein
MPGNFEHSQHSLKMVGVEASDLHDWMDRPSRELGPTVMRYLSLKRLKKPTLRVPHPARWILPLKRPPI